jgi:hypothetical protein
VEIGLIRYTSPFPTIKPFPAFWAPPLSLPSWPTVNAPSLGCIRNAFLGLISAQLRYAAQDSSNSNGATDMTVYSTTRTPGAGKRRHSGEIYTSFQATRLPSARDSDSLLHKAGGLDHSGLPTRAAIDGGGLVTDRFWASPYPTFRDMLDSFLTGPRIKFNHQRADGLVA